MSDDWVIINWGLWEESTDKFIQFLWLWDQDLLFFDGCKLEAIRSSLYAGSYISEPAKVPWLITTLGISLTSLLQHLVSKFQPEKILCF